MRQCSDLALRSMKISRLPDGDTEYRVPGTTLHASPFPQPPRCSKRADMTWPHSTPALPATYWQAAARAVKGQCPRCGEAKLFRAFLKPVDQCPPNYCGL